MDAVPNLMSEYINKRLFLEAGNLPGCDWSRAAAGRTNLSKASDKLIECLQTNPSPEAAFEQALSGLIYLVYNPGKALFKCRLRSCLLTFN